MKPAALLMSLFVHGTVVAVLPAGRPATLSGPAAEPDWMVDVEYLPAAQQPAPPRVEPAPPSPEPEPTERAEPAEEPEPAPEPTPQPRARRPARSSSPTRTPPASDAAPAEPDATAAKAGPRRLSTTFSNRSTSGGGAGSSGSGGSSARERSGGPPGGSSGDEAACTQPRVKPQPIHQVPIEYSRAARAAGLTGQLVLRADVDLHGAVTRVTVVRSVGAEIDGPAKAALARWRFRPATRCGQPVAGRFTIARTFELGD